jgi:hypothetical protein
LAKLFQNGLKALTGPLFILLMALPLMAQTQIGQDLHLRGGATLSGGYDESSGTGITSQSNAEGSADVNVNGYYFAPSLVSFNLSPYYDQSRANSNYQSISNSSGINASAMVLTNTRFPGSVGFSKTWDSTGTYGVLGTPNFTTHGGDQGYSIGWSALLPNWPTLSASYSHGSGSSDVYGSSSKSSSDTHTLSLRSSYNLAGFKLGASYNQGGSHGRAPTFLSGTANEISDSTYHSETLSMSHRLPMNGYLTTSYVRSAYTNGRTDSSTSSNNTDMFDANSSFRPISKLTLTVDTSYSDNLEGSLDQQIISSGGTPVQTSLGSTSRALTMNGGVGYAVTTYLGLQVGVSHQDQFYDGSSYGATRMSATLFYNRKLLDMFTFSVTAIDSATNAGNGGLGIQGNVNFSKRFRGWDTDASVSYSQDVETLLVTYTTSFINYNAHVRKRLARRLSVSGGFGGGHSGFSREMGTTNHSESYFSSISYSKYNFSGSYTSSSGISVLTANGLSTGGLPPVVSPLDQIVYNGSGYSLSASSTPLRKLSLSASYANSRSNTLSSSYSSLNRNITTTAQMTYRVRSISLNAGYSKFTQGISAGGAPAATVKSYYFGISRWIDLF